MTQRDLVNSLFKTFALLNGIKIPCIGYGTWKLPDDITGQEAIEAAINLGYRHIDTAAAYANEQSVGIAIKNCGVSRQELFISDKLWNTKRGYPKALKAFQSTLDRLQLNYLDMYLIHWPASFATHENWKEVNSETWRAFEELYMAGTVKAIGVCNCQPHHLEAIMENAKIAPMVNQIEYHPGFMQTETVEFCKKHNILVEAWSPLGNGALLTDETLKRLAQKYNKSAAQICIRWCLQNGVLPLNKTIKPERMKENSDVFDFEICDSDMHVINRMPNIAGSGLHPDKINQFG